MGKSTSGRREFRDGQAVTHRWWTDRDGRPAQGTVRLVGGTGEVRWHGSFVSDELTRVADDLD